MQLKATLKSADSQIIITVKCAIFNCKIAKNINFQGVCDAYAN